jgi:hypothetical protein
MPASRTADIDFVTAPLRLLVKQKRGYRSEP